MQHICLTDFTGTRRHDITPAKRIFDLGVVLTLLPLLAPMALGVAAVLWLLQGRPILHAAERAGSGLKPFRAWKFRTMHPDPADAGISGGHKLDRITPAGHVLRRSRLDELPQLWNVLRGDMSLVGPRPPLPCVAERFVHVYGPVLSVRPGLTGLATLTFHGREERMLRSCRDAATCEAIYARRCIPAKARLDLIYVRNRCTSLDALILARTLAACLGLSPRPAGNGTSGEQPGRR